MRIRGRTKEMTPDGPLSGEWLFGEVEIATSTRMVFKWDLEDHVYAYIRRRDGLWINESDPKCEIWHPMEFRVVKSRKE